MRPTTQKRVFPTGSDPRLYNESLSAAREIRELSENSNWEFRSCKRIVVEETESREWEYNGVQRSTTERELSPVVGRRQPRDVSL
jgi:hypothetical protein